MFTVALIGPDGAGKTTVARELEHSLDLPTKYLYMGVNWDASDHLLPTTRLVRRLRRMRGGHPSSGGPPDPSATAVPVGAGLSRLPRVAWRGLSLANRLAEEWYRQLLTWWYVRRGTIVVFDRHFFSDYHAHDVVGERRSIGRRLHGFLLAHAYPKPDLVVFLDAPPDLLFSRKQEGTIALLERRRAEYVALAQSMPNLVTVDAGDPLPAVVRRVASVVEAFHAERRISRRGAISSENLRSRRHAEGSSRLARRRRSAR